MWEKVSKSFVSNLWTVNCFSLDLISVRKIPPTDVAEEAKRIESIRILASLKADRSALSSTTNICFLFLELLDE